MAECDMCDRRLLRELSALWKSHGSSSIISNFGQANVEIQ